jgi:hypothetical protein
MYKTKIALLNELALWGLTRSMNISSLGTKRSDRNRSPTASKRLLIINALSQGLTLRFFFAPLRLAVKTNHQI